MIKCNNKQIKQAYEQYKKSILYDLTGCYDRYSQAKQNAWEYCLQLFIKYNGYNLKIIGYNNMTFSVGFVGDIMDETTGEIKKAFFYITKSYDRYMIIDENNSMNL